MELKKDSEQSIVFVFEFPSLRILKSSFTKLQHRFECQTSNIRENKDGSFQLRITRTLAYNTEEIERHKNQLIEDLTYYNGKFIEFKVHKVIADDKVVNKRVPISTKLYTFLTKIGGTGLRKTYNMPLFSVVVLLILMLVFSLVIK